jgi:hypothetical protein
LSYLHFLSTWRISVHQPAMLSTQLCIWCSYLPQETFWVNYSPWTKFLTAAMDDETQLLLRSKSFHKCRDAIIIAETKIITEGSW